MEKSTFRKLIYGLFAVVILTVAGLPAADIYRKPAMESYRDAATGLEFPARIGSYEKVMVRVNPEICVGTDISYESESGALADVYLYSLSAPEKEITQELFKKHAETTLTRILAMKENSRYIRSVVLLQKDVQGDFCSALFKIGLEKETLYSRLYLCIRDNRIVKIRVSVPVEQENSAVPEDPFGPAVMELKKTTQTNTQTTGE